MLSFTQQESIIKQARRNKPESINRITKSDYANTIYKDADLINLLNQDINDYKRIIQAKTNETAINIYADLDTYARDKFMEIFA